jgi:hypothetical protein
MCGTLVQADAQATITEHTVGVGPGIVGRELGEAESLVELNRSDDVIGGDADFQEATEHTLSVSRP